MPNPEFNTLEEARAEILRLNEELSTVTTERDNYSTRINDLENENKNVRELNQKYFLKLSAQYNPKPDEDGDDPDDQIPSCADLAKSLTI